MDLQEINRIELSRFLPTHKFSSHTVEEKYKIMGVKQMNTKFGKKIYVELNDSFGVYLPARISKFVENHEDFLNNMIAEFKKGDLYLQYFAGGNNAFELVIERDE